MATKLNLIKELKDYTKELNDICRGIAILTEKFHNNENELSDSSRVNGAIHDLLNQVDCGISNNVYLLEELMIFIDCNIMYENEEEGEMEQ